MNKLFLIQCAVGVPIVWFGAWFFYDQLNIYDLMLPPDFQNGLILFLSIYIVVSLQFSKSKKPTGESPEITPEKKTLSKKIKQLKRNPKPDDLDLKEIKKFNKNIADFKAMRGVLKFKKVGEKTNIEIEDGLPDAPEKVVKPKQQETTEKKTETKKENVISEIPIKIKIGEREP